MFLTVVIFLKCQVCVIQSAIIKTDIKHIQGYERIYSCVKIWRKKINENELLLTSEIINFLLKFFILIKVPSTFKAVKRVIILMFILEALHIFYDSQSFNPHTHTSTDKHKHNVKVS